MVEFVLISVAVVAILMFALNMRSLRAGDTEQRVLDGSPHWESGVVVSVERTGQYLGLPVARLVVALGEQQREHDLTGPLPPMYANALAAGLAVEGHVEYDLLDTIRTDLWDASPGAVLEDCAARLGVEAAPTTTEPRTLTFTRNGRSIDVCVGEDGWMMVTYNLPEPQPVAADLRADFDIAENARMLTPRLGIMPDFAQQPEALERLTPATLNSLEEFAVTIEGWVCIDHEAFDFECALPFPHAEIVVTLVEGLVPVLATVERELRGEADGVW